MGATAEQENAPRFSGFADLYDRSRPAPPEALGPILMSYAKAVRPAVIDLGCGTGLSTRWAASWAGLVIGIEPNDDMRSVAHTQRPAGVCYHRGFGHETGLATGAADIVMAVQAMHWMDPEPTLAEVARLLRPTGVFAVADADWPPVSGLVAAEDAWATVHRRIRVFEARASRDETGDDLRRPIADDDPALVDEDLSDPHKNRALPAGVRSWSKSRHLDNLVSSGHFEFVRELVFHQPIEGGADRFVALMRSQGSYQGLRRLGLSDHDIGADDFDRQVQAAFSAARSWAGLSFSWRVRVGVTPPAAVYRG